MRRQKESHKEVLAGLEPLFPRLWRYCLALTGKTDRADDLAQAACVRALEKSNLYQSGTRLDLWLLRLTQRLWLNELRHEAIRRGGGILAIDEIELSDGRGNPETNLLAREVLLEVMNLPEAQRTTVLLIYVEGYSYKEGAEILSIPIGTVMSRLAAARSKLSNTFEQRKAI